MPAFKGLFIKEWKMMKGFFIGPFIITVIIILLLNISGNTSMIELLLGIMAFGYIILPATVLFSLNLEVNQMELFLHNPQPIHQLISVKFLNGLLLAFSYLLIMAMAITGVELIWDELTLSVLETFFLLNIFVLRMIIVSIFPAVILLFFWSLHQIFRTYIRGLSIIAVVLILIGSLEMMVWFWSTRFYEALTKWGTISIQFVDSNVNGFPLSFHLGAGNTLDLGSYVFYGILSALIYFLSAYLIDRKVEV